MDFVLRVNIDTNHVILINFQNFRLFGGVRLQDPNQYLIIIRQE